MTLAKAVEAAREALKIALNQWNSYSTEGYSRDLDDEDTPESFIYQHGKQALASLPEPMSEDEILNIVMAANEWNDGGMVLPNNARHIIRALKSAGALYCKEGK